MGDITEKIRRCLGDNWEKLLIYDTDTRSLTMPETIDEDRKILRSQRFCLSLSSVRIVLQRVRKASVAVTDGNDQFLSSINEGYLLLVGCSEDDCDEDIEWLTSKIVNLRVMDDENGVMNRSILDTGGEILVVSQFTLWASYKKGNRPSYLRAGSHEVTEPLYEKFCDVLSGKLGKKVQTGVFGAEMQVSLVNDGPVTICMDTKNKE